MSVPRASRSLVSVSIALAAGALAIACSSAPSSSSSIFVHGQSETGAAVSDDGGASNATGGGAAPNLSGNVAPSVDAGPPCVNLQCQQVACAGGATTTVSGTIYDPGGVNPLYNVVVYVPNAPVQAFTDSATCDTCAALYTGEPLVTTNTDASGKFTLANVPAGTNIPLVIQIGKWRRQITVPTVTSCVDNPLTNKDQTRLPKNRTEGDLPKMAVSTGGADSLECLLQRIGVDPAEYTSSTGAERVHIYQGTGGNAESGGSPASQTSLWDSETDLAQYDIVILSCEGGEYGSTKPTTSLQALEAYANAGGRVFASHFHYYWFEGAGSSADFQGTANWQAGSNGIGSGSDNVTSGAINTTFPKGVAFQQWMQETNSLQADGTMEIEDSRQNASVSPTVNTASQAWITDTTVPTMTANGKTGPTTMYFDFNTPIAATPANQCGRIVYSDLHVGAAAGNYASSKVVPTGCSASPLTPQEKALEFMLFDLSSCVTPDSAPPTPPAPTPPQPK
jgi:hypothetical protein